VRTLVEGYNGKKESKKHESEVHLPRLRELIQRILVTGGTMGHTYRLWNDKRGEYRWIHLDSSVKTQADDSRLLYGVYSDVSEQRHLEGELVYANEKMQDIVNAIPGGVAIYKMTNIFETKYFSDGLAEMTGYSVEEYGQLVEDNISTVVETREKFQLHRQFIDEKIGEFEEKQMNAEDFTAKEKDNLNNLRTIGRYLTRTLDEHQRILGQHFDLKKLYDEELENYSNMTLVQRFPFRSDVYDVILKDVSLLQNIDKVFNPLFIGQVNKIFNPEKMLEYQKKLKKSGTEDEDLELDFDEEAYSREKEQRRLERMKKYEGCVSTILEQLLKHRELTLETLNTGCDEEAWNRLLPTAEIFREVMIEFLTAGTIDIQALQRDQTDYLMDASDGFVLNETLLSLMEDRKFRKIGKILIFPIEDGGHVHFKNVMDEFGNRRNFRCSNIGFRYEER